MFESTSDVEVVERWIAYSKREADNAKPLGPEWVKRYWQEAPK